MKRFMIGLALVLFLASGYAVADVVEFYNRNLDNYFITADPVEQAAVDSGAAGPGWSHTYQNFKAGGTAPVCRFYGSQSPGPNSHFYTVNSDECTNLKVLAKVVPSTVKRWNFESLDFSTTPPAADGTCPAGATPVYRAYNNGSSRGVDSNHRITASKAAIQEVVSRGWTSEGVVMCAPPQCAAPQFWTGSVCVYPMGMKVFHANQLPQGVDHATDLRWQVSLVDGTVKFIETSATMAGYNDRPVMFAFYRNTTAWYGYVGLWNYLPIYVDDLSSVGPDIYGGTSDEPDWVYGTERGIITHSMIDNNCYLLAWDAVHRSWAVNGTGAGTPIPCPND